MLSVSCHSPFLFLSLFNYPWYSLFYHISPISWPFYSSVYFHAWMSLLWINLKFLVLLLSCCFVTGTSVHPPRQRNSTYIKTFIRSIYEIRLPEHPHLPILQWELRPQGPASRPRYVESCLDTALLNAMSTSTSTAPCISAAVTITAITAPQRQEPAQCRIRYSTIAPSSAFIVTCWQPFLAGFDSIVFDFIRLNCFFNSIRLTFNVFIFDLSNTIWLTFQSGFRELHIGKVVSRIFQHWNHGIYHNSDNWNWVWQKHSNKINKRVKKGKRDKNQRIEILSTPQIF